jgi:hypothetical protein
MARWINRVIAKVATVAMPVKSFGLEYDPEDDEGP